MWEREKALPLTPCTHTLYWIPCGISSSQLHASRGGKLTLCEATFSRLDRLSLSLLKQGFLSFPPLLFPPQPPRPDPSLSMP